MSRVTYWAEFIYYYEYFDSVDNQWYMEESSDSGRFHCPKKNLKKEVEKHILKELEGEKIRNLTFDIYYSYPTTDTEV